MTTANFEQMPAPEPPRRGFRRPADHYSSASPDPALPQWLSLGCGGLALLALIVIFGGAAWIGSSGFGKFIDLTLGLSLGEMRGMYGSNIPDADKKELETEVETMRAHLRSERLPTTKLQPFLRELSRATRDGKVTREEVDRLTAHAANANQSVEQR